MKTTALWIGLLAAGMGSAVSTPAIAAQQEAVQQEQDTDRKVIRRVTPIYPMVARKARLNGKVKMVALVAADGKVQSVKIIGGHALFVAAAETAVKQWKFEAATTESRQDLTFAFNYAP